MGVPSPHALQSPWAISLFARPYVLSALETVSLVPIGVPISRHGVSDL